MQRCAVGDEPACAELVAEHQRMVVQLAMNLLGDRDEALDLSQEVFLRVFRTIHRFRGQSSLRTWIYRIAVNQARNRHRFWRRRHRADQVSLDAHVAAHGDFLSGGEARPGSACSRRRSWPTRLQHALDHLPFDQRTAIVLREIDGLSYEEIAYSLGVAVGTVKSRLTRARQALRLELREERTHEGPHLRGDAPAAAGVSRRGAAGRRSDRGQRAPRMVRRLRGGVRRAARLRRGAARGCAGPRWRCRATRKRALQAAVVSRVKAERTSRWSAQAREMFEDMHLVYAGLGAAVAAVVLASCRHDRPDALSDRIARLESQNPVQVDEHVLMPACADRAVCDARRSGGGDMAFMLSRGCHARRRRSEPGAASARQRDRPRPAPTRRGWWRTCSAPSRARASSRRESPGCRSR